MTKRTDLIVALGTLALVLLAAAIIAATGNTNEVVAWAWERHHNELSWYIRPLFFLPFCYFAYKRTLTGIAITLVALATSMAWFPAPEVPSRAAVGILAAEEEYLTGNWALWKVLLALIVPATDRKSV